MPHPDQIAHDIARFKAEIHGHFLGGQNPVPACRMSEGMFVYGREDRADTIKAMARQIEAVFGSEVGHFQYNVFEIPPQDGKCMCHYQKNGYMGWKRA